MQALGVLGAAVNNSDAGIAAAAAVNDTQCNYLSHAGNYEGFKAIKGRNNGDQKACVRRNELELWT